MMSTELRDLVADTIVLLAATPSDVGSSIASERSANTKCAPRAAPTSAAPPKELTGSMTGVELHREAHEYARKVKCSSHFDYIPRFSCHNSLRAACFPGVR